MTTAGIAPGVRPSEPQPQDRVRGWLLWVAVALLVLGSLAATGLMVVRVGRTQEATFLFMAWNLFLAWLPLVFALILAGLHRLRVPGPVLGLVGIPWLLVLPNAPYMVTDIIHLYPRRGVPLWYDAALLGSHAVLGVALGLLSVLIVHRVVAARAGELAGWCVALASQPLSVVGVQLGRVHRFNSWDVLHPSRLIDIVTIRLMDPLGNPRLVVIGVAATLALTVAYALLMGLARITRAYAPAR